MVETQQQRVAQAASKHLEQLQQATLQAAFAAAETGNVPTLADALAVADAQGGRESGKAGAERAVGAVSPKNGAVVPPGTGRPKGVRNRLTALRDSILDAFEEVGGTQYLAKLAQGTQSDRAAFIGLVKHVLPAQIDANVNGGIQVQLSWLGGRSIGTTAAQPAEVVTQVVDLQRDSNGKYRMIDPQTQAVSPEPDAIDPPSPHQSAGGGQA